MSQDAPSGGKPRNRPNADPKKPRAPAKAKGADREARLAEALRENLRRRKAAARDEETKDD